MGPVLGVCRGTVQSHSEKSWHVVLPSPRRPAHPPPSPLCTHPLPPAAQHQGARGAGALLRPRPAAAAVPARLCGGNLPRWVAGRGGLCELQLPSCCMLPTRLRGRMPASGLVLHPLQAQPPSSTRPLRRSALLVRRGPGGHRAAPGRAAGRRRRPGRHPGARAVPAAGAGHCAGGWRGVGLGWWGGGSGNLAVPAAPAAPTACA